MNIRNVTLSITLFLISYSALAGCIDINNTTYCGKGRCIKLNNIAYCSGYDYGEISVNNGAAYCGAGRCLTKGGRVYCSQYPGGDIIENNGALWTGPGQCVKYNGSVRCSKVFRGVCREKEDNMQCQGGWVKEIPVVAHHCQRAEPLPD